MHEIELQPDLLEGHGLSKAEIEVRLAIADYFIRHAAGTAHAHEAFNRLVTRFEGRYPHHKMLTQLLISPEHLNAD